jgi:hypothetical protein
LADDRNGGLQQLFLGSMSAFEHIPAPHHEQHFDYGLGLLVAGIRSEASHEEVLR